MVREQSLRRKSTKGNLISSTYAIDLSKTARRLFQFFDWHELISIHIGKKVLVGKVLWFLCNEKGSSVN